MERSHSSPVIRGVRHELVRREGTIVEAGRLTPNMIRLVVAGEALAGFTSLGFDDHIKLTLPQSDGAVERRDFTPRRFDAAKGALTVDFVDHPGGPAADFARAARVGDRLGFGGPRGSRVIEGDIVRWLLIGDETALPAIGRAIEEAGTDAVVDSLVGVAGAAEEQTFETRARHRPRWLHRPAEAATDADIYINALKTMDIPPRTFVWIAAEAGVAKAIRGHLAAERGHPPGWLKSAGYWVKGQADAAVKDLDSAG